MDWIDPTRGYPSDVLIAGVREIPYRYVAVTGELSHKTVASINVIHAEDLDLDPDGRVWEVFGVSHQGTIRERDLYWGSFLLGLGLIHVMVPAEQVRELSEEEKVRLRKQRLAIGGLTGSISYEVPTPSY